MSEDMIKAVETEEKAAGQNQDEENLEQSEKLQKKIKRSERSVKRYQWFILRLVIFLIVLWVLFFKIIGITRMPGDEMYPRIDGGDMVMYYRLDKNVKAQDVVVLEKETPDISGKQLYILRVVAVAGDTVEITGEQALKVNGNTMVEPNIFYPTSPYSDYTKYPLTLEDGQCFVLADKRDGGSDSRYFGPVDKKELLGTVITIVRRNNL